MRAESGGNSRPLKLILMPSDGYTIPYIRDLLGSNTLLYICPMKSCLSLDKPPHPVNNQSPQTNCPKCSLSIPIIQLRKHSFTCSGIEVHDSDCNGEKELERSVFDRVLPVQKAKDESKPSVSGSVVEPLASCSTGSSFFDAGIASLTTLFPDDSKEDVREALLTYEDVDLAACVLMSRATDGDQTQEEGQAGNDVWEILEKLRAKMKSSVSAERLKVDKEDVAIDLLQYFKSKEFDPKIPISVRFRGQPGLDSGGLLRQAFTSAFDTISQNKVPGLKLFTGQPCRLTPVCSSENLLTEIFKILRKMIGHSLIQDGPGFPYLAPAIYWYIATGDLDEAVGRTSHIDVVDEDLLMILDKVSNNKCRVRKWIYLLFHSILNAGCKVV